LVLPSPRLRVSSAQVVSALGLAAPSETGGIRADGSSKDWPI